MTLDRLIAKLARACNEREALERRQDEICVDWTLLQADMEILNSKLEAFAKAVPGCLGAPKEKIK